MRTLVLLMLIGVVGCGPVGRSALPAGLTADSSLATTPAPASPQTPAVPSTPTETATKIPSLGLCSGLDFSGVAWSSTLPPDQREIFALALSITGSFEGAQNWSTLTDDFDGQGFSLGLLNQNLGQGSLEPMLVEMQNSYPAAFTKSYSVANLQSLQIMLAQWRGSSAKAAVDLRDFGYSKLDDPALVAAEMGVSPHALVSASLSSRDQAAVSWAVKTVYNGSTFKSDWSHELAGMAATPGYRSIQIHHAESLHNQAMNLFNLFKLTQLRSYLFLFDVVVQTGGMGTTLQAKYATWLHAHASATETDKLNELLSLRLTSVLAKYVNDVSSRKRALINGSGTVHGQARSFDHEYCVSLTTVL